MRPIWLLVGGSMHGGLGDGGEQGRQRGPGTYWTGITIGMILSCKDSELFVGGA